MANLMDIYRGKRGQVTVFIIVGIIILAITAGTFYIVKKATTERLEVGKEATIPIGVEGVKSYIENCLEDTTEEAIHYNFLTGGIYLPTFITFYGEWTVPYYFYLGEDAHPLKEQVEEGLSRYVEDNLAVCLGNFKSFAGIAVKAEVPEVKTVIQKKKVEVTLKMPVEIRSGEQIKKLDVFTTTLNVPLAKVLAAVEEQMANQLTEPNEVLLTSWVDDAEEQEYKLNTLYRGDEVIYLLEFENIIVKSKPLQVQFAAKYNWFGELNKNVDLEPLGKQQLKAGELFLYPLKTKGDTLMFNISSDLAAKEVDGQLSIFPKAEDVGEHYVWVTAYNALGQDTEMMMVEVTEKSE